MSGINRDTCQASAETLTGILRDAFVVLQPNQHSKSGAPGGNRTPDLDVRTVLLYPLSYEGDSRSLVIDAPCARPLDRVRASVLGW